MIVVRRNEDRGFADHGWLKSRHTFSFASYHDPNQMGFGFLRVINEDQISGGSGFDSHPHRDMEIISYVIEGALEHKDSMGNRTVIRPGEIQRMSAGTGVIHSEYNHLSDQDTHFLQIWLLPQKNGEPPSYDQINFSDHLAGKAPLLIASGEKTTGAIYVHQDVKLFLLKSKQSWFSTMGLEHNQIAWVQVIRGEIKVGSEMLVSGDGAAITNSETIDFHLGNNCEGLLFVMRSKAEEILRS